MWPVASGATKRSSLTPLAWIPPNTTTGLQGLKLVSLELPSTVGDLVADLAAPAGELGELLPGVHLDPARVALLGGAPVLGLRRRGREMGRRGCAR